MTNMCLKTFSHPTSLFQVRYCTHMHRHLNQLSELQIVCTYWQSGYCGCNLNRENHFTTKNVQTRGDFGNRNNLYANQERILRSHNMTCSIYRPLNRKQSTHGLSLFAFQNTYIGRAVRSIGIQKQTLYPNSHMNTTLNTTM